MIHLRGLGAVMPRWRRPVASSRESARPAPRPEAIHPIRWLLRLGVAAAVLAMALVGFLYLTRGSAVRHVRAIDASGAPVAPEEPEFPLNVGLLTGAVLLSGNRIELGLNGDGTFPRLWDDLRSAKQSIAIQMYYGQPGHVADTLRNILLERAAAGVRVVALYDAFGTTTIPPERLAALRAAGVIAVAFRPPRLSSLNVIQNRSHVRAIIVDGRIGWTGGFGFDDKWLGDGRSGWRDTNVRFEGPAVRQLQAAFAAAWTEATGELLSARVTLPDRTDSGATAALFYASPTLGSTAAERFLALSIAGARKSLYVTNAYFAPDESFLRFITDAAGRGVDVRLLLAGPRTDVRLARWAARSHYQRLLAAGVHIYEWQPSSLHAKTFVVDGLWSSIGTMNFDNRSLVLNEEVTLMVLDASFGQRMNTVFMNDLRLAKEISAAQFSDRPWTERVAEWGAQLVSRVL
jgi:cardiolipin synthase